jgi:hypothetical protein
MSEKLTLTWQDAHDIAAAVRPKPVEVMLSQEEEMEYGRLFELRNELECLWRKENEQARKARQNANITKKQFHKIQAKWLLLAERKFPR